MSNAHPPPARRAPSVALALTIATCCGCLAPVAYVLRGCMTEHTRHDNGDFTFDVSPDGRTIVFAGVGKGRRDLYLFDLASRKVEPLTSSDDYEICPAFSPDGKRVAFTRGVPGIRADQLCVIDLETRKVIQLTDADENVSSPCFRPNGKSILCTVEGHYRWSGLASSWDEGGQLREINLASKEQTILKAKTSRVWSPRVSRDGKWTVWHNQQAFFAPSAHLEEANVLAKGGYNPTPNADGSRFAVSTGEYAPGHRIFIVDRSGARHLVADSEGSLFSVFSPDGRRLYFLSEYGDHSGLKVANVATGKSAPVATMQLFWDPMSFRQ